MKHPSDELPKLVRDILYAQDHRLLDDLTGLAAMRCVHAGVTDEFVRGLITDRVSRHKIGQAFQGPFSRPHLTHGELSLGRVWSLNNRGHGELITFPMQYLNGHCLTIGGSGSGKTTKSRFLALQVLTAVAGAWLVDLRKREFAFLQELMARINIELIVIPARQLRINPLQVPLAMTPVDWAAQVADMLIQVLDLPARASKLLQVTIINLYRQFGVSGGGGKEFYPTLFDLYEAIKTNRDANAQARQAVLDSLEPVLLSLGPEVLAYRKGWTTHDLAQRKIVFELGGISETDKDLILNTLILSECSSRIAQGISNPRMDLWICCDEAARLVAPSNHGSRMADIIGLVRGTGIGLDLSVQSSDIIPGVFSNTANKFIGRCGSARDYDAIGSAMGLTPDQKHWLTMNLRPGLFVGQLGEGDWRRPFLFQVPSMDFNSVCSSDVRCGPGGLQNLPTLPS